MYDKWQCGYVNLKPLLWLEIYYFNCMLWSQNIQPFSLFILVFLKPQSKRSFHYMLMLFMCWCRLVHTVNIQYTFGNAGCVKYQMEPDYCWWSWISKYTISLANNVHIIIVLWGWKRNSKVKKIITLLYKKHCNCTKK